MVIRDAPSAAAAVEEALRRVQALDGEIEAWAYVDAEGAREQARVLDARDDRAALPLLGLVAGVKDIFDVAGMPTTLGAPPFFHTRPDADATSVARLRQAGAVILGKTHTTEFAYLDPAPTRNPWNREHTPGGSSSGSAAAVAAGMVPLALGSQTVGSVLRPAGYCGVVGLKPSHGRVSSSGVHPLAPSFDHVGLLCRSVELAARGLDAIAGFDASDPYSSDLPVAKYATAVASYQGPPRIGYARAFGAEAAEPPVRDHLDAVAQRLAAAGADLVEVTLPLTPQQVSDMGQGVMRSEAAAVHARRFREHPEEYRPNIRHLVEMGLEVHAVDYLNARTGIRAFRGSLLELLAAVDVLLLPVSPTTAPAGLSSTGNAIFCAPASFTGLPAIALPSGLDAAGLPFALQLVAPPFDEARLLAIAGWTERVLDFAARPPLYAA